MARYFVSELTLKYTLLEKDCCRLKINLTVRSQLNFYRSLPWTNENVAYDDDAPWVKYTNSS